MDIDVWPGISSGKDSGLPGWKDVVVEYVQSTEREGNTALTRLTVFNLDPITGIGFNLDFCLILISIRQLKIEDNTNLAHFTGLRTF